MGNKPAAMRKVMRDQLDTCKREMAADRAATAKVLASGRVTLKKGRELITSCERAK
jgi:hypothetical protein